MLLVSHKITIGTDRYSTPSNSRLLSLLHSARMDVPVNTCTIVMGPAKGLSIKPNDPIKVELGTGISTTQVFEGKIAEVDWRMESVQIEASGSSRALVYGRYNMYFEQSAAGDIVADLCSKASVSTGAVQPGIMFDYYAVSSNRNAANQIWKLAVQCGFDAYTNEKDKLAFAMFVPANLHMLQYAVNILGFSAQVPGEGVGETEVFGESPSSLGQGPQAASWLTKKNVSGSSSGASGSKFSVFEPGIRSTSMAGLAAQAYKTFLLPKKKGTITVPGDARIKLGDAVQVSKMPLSEQNGTFKICGVEHSITLRYGFITRLIVESI